MDVLPPVISNCPFPITVNAPANAGTDLPVFWVPPTVTDNSGIVIPILISHQPGDRFLVGQTTTVVYTYADNAGLTSECRFDVTVVAFGKYCC